MGSETKAHPQRWDNFGNRRSAMDRAGKYLTLPYLTNLLIFVQKVNYISCVLPPDDDTSTNINSPAAPAYVS